MKWKGRGALVVTAGQDALRQLYQAKQQRPDRLNQKREILQQRRMQHVLQIVPGFVLGGVLLSQPVHLGQPGHTRLYREPLLLPGGILLGAFRSFRPWTHQAHFPAQHIQVGAVRQC